jgi:hypothetical protein
MTSVVASLDQVLLYTTLARASDRRDELQLEKARACSKFVDLLVPIVFNTASSEQLATVQQAVKAWDGQDMTTLLELVLESRRENMDVDG